MARDRFTKSNDSETTESRYSNSGNGSNFSKGSQSNSNSSSNTRSFTRSNTTSDRKSSYVNVGTVWRNQSDKGEYFSIKMNDKDMEIIARDLSTGQEFKVLKLNLFENSNPKRPEAIAFDVTVNTDPERKGVLPLN